ncbi:hypothetical protein [Massilia sp. Root335]|jgi:hypothetical protein|uniref:hypothetical protein n=1 Tax=Massilia sp. Root335 TaxID=1736517 RepID=UPI0006F292E2|nr:hypothetical protein [Massilia sp. Root335]KQV36922.1 hypothetical protein ASC93_22130 [Massilia sp. Root335]
MFQSVLRLATGAVLMSAALCASAAPATYKDFKLSGVLQEIPGPSARCASNFGGTILGFGTSSLVGKVTFLASDCIAPSGTSYTFSQGKFLVTTMTGELIFANYSGQFVPTGEGAKFVFSGATFQVTGGTGRYARATGGGDMTGGEDMTTGQGTIQLTGRILTK